MNPLLHTVNPVILKLKMVVVLWMFQCQVFQKLVLILVLFPMLLTKGNSENCLRFSFRIVESNSSDS